MSGRESRNPISICLSDFQTTPQFSRLPGGSNSKESPCSIRDPGLIPGSGRSLVEWNGNPVQYSCLENPMDRGTWWATAHGVIKQANMTERLTPFFTFTLSCFPPCLHTHFERIWLPHAWISEAQPGCFLSLPAAGRGFSFLITAKSVGHSPICFPMRKVRFLLFPLC